MCLQNHAVTITFAHFHPVGFLISCMVPTLQALAVTVSSSSTWAHGLKVQLLTMQMLLAFFPAYWALHTKFKVCLWNRSCPQACGDVQIPTHPCPQSYTLSLQGHLGCEWVRNFLGTINLDLLGAVGAVWAGGFNNVHTSFWNEPKLMIKSEEANKKSMSQALDSYFTQTRNDKNPILNI